MIFVDSNVPMYLIGAHHPHKIDSHHLLEQSIAAGERLVTDSEVFHEILHRYAAINRREAIQPAFEALLGVVDEVFPIDIRDVGRAKEIVLTMQTLSARDALHIAAMERHSVVRILTFDAGFDGFPGILRVTA